MRTTGPFSAPSAACDICREPLACNPDDACLITEHHRPGEPTARNVIDMCPACAPFARPSFTAFATAIYTARRTAEAQAAAALAAQDPA